MRLIIPFFCLTVTAFQPIMGLAEDPSPEVIAEKMSDVQKDAGIKLRAFIEDRKEAEKGNAIGKKDALTKCRANEKKWANETNVTIKSGLKEWIGRVDITARALTITFPDQTTPLLVVRVVSAGIPESLKPAIKGLKNGDWVKFSLLPLKNKPLLIEATPSLPVHITASGSMLADIEKIESKK